MALVDDCDDLSGKHGTAIWLWLRLLTLSVATSVAAFSGSGRSLLYIAAISAVVAVVEELGLWANRRLSLGYVSFTIASTFLSTAVGGFVGTRLTRPDEVWMAASFAACTTLVLTMLAAIKLMTSKKC